MMALLARILVLLFLGVWAPGDRPNYPGDGRPITIVFDRDVPQSLVDEVIAGSHYWDCLGVQFTTMPGGKVLRITVGDVPVKIGVALYMGDDSIKFDLRSMGLLHDPREHIAIAAHEFGHALGLQHSKNTSDVMNHIVPPVNHLSSRDIQAFNDVWHTHYSSSACSNTNKTIAKSERTNPLLQPIESTGGDSIAYTELHKLGYKYVSGPTCKVKGHKGHKCIMSPKSKDRCACLMR